MLDGGNCTRVVVEDFFMKFLERLDHGCFTNNKTFDFEVDSGHDPYLGIIQRNFYHFGTGNVIVRLLWDHLPWRMFVLSE